MKTLKIFTILAIGLLFASCSEQNQKGTEIKTIDKGISKIEVYDFHSTHRCLTCNSIESNTKYTLDTHFAKELQEGKITFQIINIDENEKIAEKFQASGTSLILNVIIKGEESQINITDFAFMKGKDQEAFSKELKAKIDTELKKL